MDGGNFERVSDKMVATVGEGRIDGAINILQEKFNASVSLGKGQFDLIKGELPERVERPVPKAEVKEPEFPQMDDLELEALEVELELLEFGM